MNTTPPFITPPPRPSTGNLRSTTPSARPPHSENPTDRDLAAGIPLIGIVPFGLPSPLLVLGWTFLALSLAGPFLVLVTVVLVTAVVVGVAAAAVVPPYLLVRSVAERQARQPRRRRLSDEVRERRATVQLSSPAHLHVAVRLPTEARAPLP
jgi:hypothetical protein